MWDRHTSRRREALPELFVPYRIPCSDRFESTGRLFREQLHPYLVSGMRFGTSKYHRDNLPKSVDSELFRKFQPDFQDFPRLAFVECNRGAESADKHMSANWLQDRAYKERN